MTESLPTPPNLHDFPYVRDWIDSIHENLSGDVEDLADIVDTKADQADLDALEEVTPLVYIQPNEPLGVDEGDFWIDTDDDSSTTIQEIVDATMAAGLATKARKSWFNVRDYGAVGDGIADDTAAVQAAVTAVNVVDGTLYFPYGTYQVASEIKLIGASLQGDGFGSRIRLTTSSARVVMDSTHWSKITSIRIDGNLVANEGLLIGADVGGLGSGINGMHIDTVYVLQCAGNGVRIRNLQNSVITNLHSASNGGTGVEIQRGCGNLVFNHLQMNGNKRGHLHVYQDRPGDVYSASIYPAPQYIIINSGIGEGGNYAYDGTTTSGTPTTVTVAGATWATNEWVGGFVTCGTNVMATAEGRRIIGNTADTITVDRAFTVATSPVAFRISYSAVRIDTASGLNFHSFVIQMPASTGCAAGLLVYEGSIGGTRILINTPDDHGTLMEFVGPVCSYNLPTSAVAGNIGAVINGGSNVRLPGLPSPQTMTAGDIAIPYVLLGGATVYGAGAQTRQTGNAWTTDTTYDSSSTAMFRNYVPGDGQTRHYVTASGEIWWGSGAVTADTNLYRGGADMLKTSDKFVATGGIGVGNSAVATTPGAVVRKMEIFDSSGASLGFVAIYNGIT